MSRADDILKNLNSDGFLKEFLDRYLADGFGTMTKKQFELELLKLITKYHRRWGADASDYTFEISSALGITEKKVRSLLDELDLKDAEKDSDWCDDQLKIVLAKAELIADGTMVQVQINRGILRQRAREIVEEEFGIVDWSFNSSILKLSGQKFLALTTALMSDDEQNRVEAELARVRGEANQQRGELLKEFVKGVVSGSGRAIGQTATNFCLDYLTGGATYAVRRIRQVWNALNDVDPGEPGEVNDAGEIIDV